MKSDVFTKIDVDYINKMYNTEIKKMDSISSHDHYRKVHRQTNNAVYVNVATNILQNKNRESENKEKQESYHKWVYLTDNFAI